MCISLSKYESFFRPYLMEGELCTNPKHMHMPFCFFRLFSPYLEDYICGPPMRMASSSRPSSEVTLLVSACLGASAAGAAHRSIPAPPHENPRAARAPPTTTIRRHPTRLLETRDNKVDRIHSLPAPSLPVSFLADSNSRFPPYNSIKLASPKTPIPHLALINPFPPAPAVTDRILG